MPTEDANGAQINPQGANETDAGDDSDGIYGVIGDRLRQLTMS